MISLGYETKSMFTLNRFTQEIQKSFQIEGENISDYSLRSSVARHLGLENVILASGEQIDERFFQCSWGDFQGKLTSTKYAEICKCSQNTASRGPQHRISAEQQELIIFDAFQLANQLYSLHFPPAFPSIRK